MNILVDVREQTLLKVLTALRTEYRLKVEINQVKLDLGDLIIRHNDTELVIIERKRLTDLAASIRDGRYKEQSYRLDGYPLHNHQIIYLIEGQMGNYSDRYTKVSYETLYTTMCRLQYFKGFSVMRSFDISETAEIVLRMADKIGREPNKEGHYDPQFKQNKGGYAEVVNKVKKKNITPQNMGEIVLAQVPGVSNRTARLVMRGHSSLYQLLCRLYADRSLLDDIVMETSTGQMRHISRTSRENIINFLLRGMAPSLKVCTSRDP